MKKIFVFAFLAFFLLVGCEMIPKNITVQFNTLGGPSVPSQTINFGSLIDIPEELVWEGYTFGGWFTEAEFTNAYSFTTIPSSNITLYAKWNINQYTIN
ncbi:MAG: InlB B-repeat-containing protein, partial [Bacilli bacterium]